MVGVGVEEGVGSFWDIWFLILKKSVRLFWGGAGQAAGVGREG
jgi:hypothetical protein